MSRNIFLHIFILVPMLFCFILQDAYCEIFNIRKNLLETTTWIEDPIKIYYVKGKEKDLYSINIDGSDERKILESLANRVYGWSPSGEKMFVVTKNGLIIMNSDGTDQLKIVSNIKVEEQDIPFFRLPAISSPTDVEWSPNKKYIIYGIVDRDTNGNGKIEPIYDSLTYYLFNLETKEKREIFRQRHKSFPKDYVHQIVWHDNSREVYIFNTVYTSGNDRVGQVLSYNIESHQLTKLKEGVDRKGGGSHSSESYIETFKDNISFTRKNFQTNDFTYGYDLEEINGIKISFDRQKGELILQKTSPSPELLTQEYILGKHVTTGDVYPRKELHHFLWLPDNKLIIFFLENKICIFDPYNMKAGFLVEGIDFGWFNPNPSYDEMRKGYGK